MGAPLASSVPREALPLPVLALPGWQGWQQPNPTLQDRGWGAQAPRPDS